MYGNSIYFRAVAQREVRLCEFVDEAGLELHRNSDDHQNDDHATLLAVFPLTMKANLLHFPYTFAPWRKARSDHARLSMKPALNFIIEV